MKDQFEYQRAIFASDLSTNAKITALAVASHFNWLDFNPAFPGTKLLTTETGLSARSIDRAKTELKQRGFLGIENRAGTSNLYIPAIPESVTQTHRDATYVTETQVSSPDESDTPATEAQGVRHTDVGVRQSDVGGTSQWRTNKEENKEPNEEPEREATSSQGEAGDLNDSPTSFESHEEDLAPSLELEEEEPEPLNESPAQHAEPFGFVAIQEAGEARGLDLTIPETKKVMKMMTDPMWSKEPGVMTLEEALDYIEKDRLDQW